MRSGLDSGTPAPATDATFLTRHGRAVFIGVELARWAAYGADLGTTQTFLHNGSGCTEGAAFAGDHPSLGRLLTIGVPVHAGITAANYLIFRRTRHSDQGIVALMFIDGGLSGAHTLAALNNRRCL